MHLHHVDWTVTFSYILGLHTSSETTQNIGLNTCRTLDVRLLQDQFAEFHDSAQSILWIFIQLVFGFLRRLLVERAHVVGI